MAVSARTTFGASAPGGRTGVSRTSAWWAIGTTVVVYLVIDLGFIHPHTVLLNARWVLLGALGLITTGRALQARDHLPLPLPVLALLAFACLAVASASYSNDQPLSLLKGISFLLLIGGTVLAVLWDDRLRPGPWLAMLGWVNIAVVVVSVPLVPFRGGSVYDQGLFQGPFGDPNQLGSVLALTLPGLFHLMSSAGAASVHRPSRRRLLAAVVLADVVLVLMAHSRTAALAMIAAVLVYALVTSRGRMFMRVMAVAGVAAVMPLLPLGGMQRLTAFIYKGNVTVLSTRGHLFQSSFAQFLHHPFLGSGFGVLLPSSGVTASVPSGLQFTDVGLEQGSTFVGTLADVGMVGTALLFGALLLIYAGPLRNALAGTGESARRNVFAALLAVGVAGLVHMQGEAWGTSAGSVEALIFWTTTGFIVVATRLDDDRIVAADAVRAG